MGWWEGCGVSVGYADGDALALGPCVGRTDGAALSLGVDVGDATGAAVGRADADGDAVGAYVTVGASVVGGDVVGSYVVGDAVVGLSDVGAIVTTPQTFASSSHSHVGDASLHTSFSYTSAHITLVRQCGSPSSLSPPLKDAIHSQWEVDRQSISALDLDDRASHAILQIDGGGAAVGGAVVPGSAGSTTAATAPAAAAPSLVHHSQSGPASAHPSSESDTRMQSARGTSVGFGVGDCVGKSSSAASPSFSSSPCLVVGLSPAIALLIAAVLPPTVVVFAIAIAA